MKKVVLREEVLFMATILILVVSVEYNSVDNLSVDCRFSELLADSWPPVCN